MRNEVIRRLTYFLGLVPIVVGALRIYLMGQGDTGTILSLVRTLDVQAPRHARHDAGGSWAAFSIVFVILLVSVGALYPEQLLDDSNGNWGPVDVTRAVACQFESDVDAAADAPLITRLPGFTAIPYDRMLQPR